MKKISKILLSIALLSTSIHAADDPYQLKLTVKAHHNNTTRILDDNSVLFSKDAFQFNIQTSSPMYVYAFLIDSNNNIQLLDPPNTSAFVPKDGSILFPSNNTRDWYRLDDSVGEEVIVILSSPNKLKVERIYSLVESGQWDVLMSDEISVKQFHIKHLDQKVISRGLDTLAITTDEYLETPITLPPRISNNLELKPNKSHLTTKTILSILNDSTNNKLNKDTVTRGVKEVRIFKNSAPSVVLIVTTMGSGTGALVSKDGLVFTNSHVVGDAKKVRVYFMPKKAGKYSQNDSVNGIVVNNNKIVDLALIKLMTTPVGINPLNLAKISSLDIGQNVHAIGHPEGGSDWSYTRGYIGQLLKDYEWEYDDGITHKANLVIQSQTPITSGNSGGPLLNDSGLIIGVNTFGGDYTGANYAVSVEDLRLFLNEKIKLPPKTSKTSEAKRISKEYGRNVLKIKKIDYDNDGVMDTVYFLDDDKTGYIETIVVELGNTGELIIILDYDEDGHWNEKMMNTNNNPELDFHIYDYNGDGEADAYGYDDNDDGEVDRYEEV